MLTLHHLNNSRSFRILWLLEELKARYNTEYQLITHNRTASYLAPDDLKAIHPMGKAPILVDGDKALAESGFIMEYLLKTYDINGEFKPTDDKTWEDFTFWLHFAESSMMPPLVMRLVMNAVATKSPLLVRPIAKAIAGKVESLVIKDNIAQSFTLLNSHLANRDWIADTFTGADVQAYFAVKALESRGGLGEWENLKTWLNRCESRPAYKEAVQKGGRLFA